jgi:hypothetical protein
MMILLESLALSVSTNQAPRGLTQNFLDTNHFISFYIELFHFPRLRSIFRIPVALSAAVGEGITGRSKKAMFVIRVIRVVRIARIV